jgi:hypothetical protein
MYSAGGAAAPVAMGGGAGSPQVSEFHCTRPTARSRGRNVSKPAATRVDAIASTTSRRATVTSPPAASARA